MGDKYTFDDLLAEYNKSKEESSGSDFEESFAKAKMAAKERLAEQNTPDIPDEGADDRSADDDIDAMIMEMHRRRVGAVDEEEVSDFEQQATDVSAFEDQGFEDTNDDLSVIEEAAPVIGDNAVEYDDLADLEAAFGGGSKKKDPFSIAKKISKLSGGSGKNKQNSQMENPSVQRTSIRDMDLGLHNKLIPGQEEYETQDIPYDADDKIRSAMLQEHRKKKVENFVLDASDDDGGSKRSRIVNGQKEFENFDEAPKVLSDIMQVKSNLFMRMCVLLFTGISSLLITLANDLELPVINMFNRSISASAFVFTNTIMGLLALGISYTVMTAGVKNMLMRKPDCDSLAALSIFISVISGIITLFKPESIRANYYHIYVCAAIIGLIFNTLGKMMIVSRTEKNFRYVAGEFDRYAVKNVSDEAAENFGKGITPNDTNMLTMEKTGFVDDFIKHSYAPDASDYFAKKAAPIILLVGIVTALLSFICDKNAHEAVDKIYVAFAAFSGTVTMCSSISLMMTVNIPVTRASNKFLQYSSVMLGYSAVDEFGSANSLLVDAQQIFPKESVELVNLKLLSTNSLEECLLMAASLCWRSGSVLNNAFYKILKGKTDMLYPVESYVYEDELGLSGWIDNKRVLLGTRQLMESHSIDGLPPMSKEKEYSKGNVIVYLSISGVVSTMFVVRVTPSLSVKKWMQELEDEGMVLVVRTVDSFLSAHYLERLFDIGQGTIKVLPFRFTKEYEKETEYTDKVSSSLLCGGHFPSFAMLVTGVKRVKAATQLGIALQVGAFGLGAAICLVSMIMGNFSQVTPSLIVLYNLVFSGITLAMLNSRKI